MAQFDVHRNADAHSPSAVPFLLDVQAAMFDTLATRVVVPLYRVGARQATMEGLTPCFVVAGVRVMLSTPELAGVPASVLGPRVASLAAERAAIVAALDLLFTGV